MTSKEPISFKTLQNIYSYIEELDSQIAWDKDFLKTDLVKDISSKIGELLNVDLLLFGIKNENSLRDILIYRKSPISPDTVKELRQGQSIKDYGDSFIGRVIDLNYQYFSINSLNELRNLDFTRTQINSLNKYLKIADLTLNQMVIFPLTKTIDDYEEIFGYFALVNNTSSGNFSEDYIDAFRLISEYLTIVLERRLYKKAYSEDKSIINSLYKNALEKSLSDFLNYINHNFHCVCSHIWVPTKDYENKVLVLRKMRATSPNLENELQRIDQINISDSLIGKYFSNELPLSIHYSKDITKEERFALGQDFLKKINTKAFISVPIIDFESKSDNNILAVLCIHPRKDKRIKISELNRIEKLTNSLSHYVSLYIYKKRYDQIASIYEYLTKLDTTNSEKFYDQIVEMTKTVMISKSCSLFFYSQEDGTLYLKATTVSNFYKKDNQYGQIIKTFARKDYINKKEKPVYSIGDSITSNSINHSYPIIVSNVEGEGSQASFKFMEAGIGNHQTLIASSIKINGKRNAVIRCINKKSNGNTILDRFILQDEEIFNLLSHILSVFITSFEHNQIKNNFLVRLAHEIRGPVNSLSGSLSLTRHLIKQGKVKKQVLFDQIDFTKVEAYMVLNHYNNLVHVVNKDFDNIDKPTFRKQNIKRLIEKASNVIKPYSSRHYKYVNVKVNISYMPELFVDERRIMQVVYNLLINAINYAKGEPKIEIYYKEYLERYTKENGELIKLREKIIFNNTRYIELRFEDSGIGVLPNEKDRILEKGERGVEAQNINPSGSGLGLHVCKEIVEMHSGKLAITKIKNPTRISVFLPYSLISRAPKHSKKSHESFNY